MRGWHYTDARHLKTILKEGLVPQTLAAKHSDLEPYFGWPLKGVFVFARRHRGWAHLGSILWAAGAKGTTRVALFEVSFRKSQVWMPTRPEDTVQLWHDGEIGDLRYHEKERVFLLREGVPPEGLRLAGKWDLGVIGRSLEPQRHFAPPQARI